MNSVVSAITSVFSSIMSWIATSVNDLVPIFYNNDSLTFLGTLTIMGLGISIFFLLIGVISSFLRFRG